MLGLCFKKPGWRWAVAWHSAADLVQCVNHTQLQPLICITRGRSYVDPTEVNPWLWCTVMVNTMLDRLSSIYRICWHQKPYIFCRWSVTNKVIAAFRSKRAQRICCYSDNRFSCNIFRSIIQSTVNLRAPTSSADRHAWKLKIGLFLKLCVKVQRPAAPLSRTDWLTDWLQFYCIPWVPVMKSKPHGDRKYFLSCASFC